MPQLLCCVLAAAVLAAVAAAADDTDKSAFTLFNPTPSEHLRELSVDGPTKTASPYTVDAGHFQLEMNLVSYTYDRSPSRGPRRRLDEWSIAPMNLKVGLLNQVDAQLLLETYEVDRERTRRRRETRRGFGDVTLRLKYNFWGNDDGRTAFAAMPYVKLPTSEDHVGNPGVEGGLILPLEVSLPRDFDTGLMTRLDAVRDSDRRGYHAEFVHSIDLSRDLVGKLSGDVEWFSDVSTERGAAWVSTFDAGLTYRLTPNVEIEVGVDIGLTRSADDVDSFVGLAWRS